MREIGGRRRWTEHDLDGKRVLVIIPDSTRTAPIPLFFRLFHEALWGRVAALDYLVALGTHQPHERGGAEPPGGHHAPRSGSTDYAGVNLFNHRWDLPDTFDDAGHHPGRRDRAAHRRAAGAGRAGHGQPAGLRL